MQTVQFDTATQPLMRRGDYWLDAVCAPHLGVHGKTYAFQDPRFYGRLRSHDARGMLTTQVACTAGIAHRRAEHIRRWTHDASVIVLIRNKGAVWQSQDQELVLGQGDILVANPDEPYSLASEGDFDFVSFYVPRAMLAENLYPGSPEAARVIPADGAAGKLAAGFAMQLAASLDTLDTNAAAGMTEAMIRVIAVAAGAAAGAHQPSLQAAKLAQVLRYLDKHLGDANLSPTSCAQATGLSVRALHLLFEPTGETFGQTLLQKRLRLARQLLDQQPVHSITQIAYAAGFGSLAGFYRAFRRTYDATPTDLRSR